MIEGIVPKIYFCGEKEEFLAWIGNRPFELLGVVKFFGEGLNFKEDGKFELDGKIVEVDELKKILPKTDYIIFRNGMELRVMHTCLKDFEIDPLKFITRNYFKHMATDNFYDMDSDVKFMQFMQIPPIRTLLDADAHFLKSPLLTKINNEITEIDCITQEILPPIMENIYSHVYKSFSECCLKHYDAVLFNATSKKSFVSDFAKYENISDIIIMYVRNDSEMHKYIQSNAKFFQKVHILKNAIGSWLFCYRHPQKKDFAIYTVTHKKFPENLANNLPEGYKIIHAGRALAEDLGYLGDDTGDNVSNLNAYINEFTAFYWVWKNTNHTIIGFSHYRRYMTVSDDKEFSAEKILTQEQAEKLLSRYDVLANMFYGVLTQTEEIAAGYYPEDVMTLAVSIIEKYMAEVQPDYVDALHTVMNSSNFYRYNMIVTRKYVFDAYCSWLFSFFLKVTDEISKRIDFADKSKRLAGFLGERMFTVWVMKNRLRIREMNVMQVPDL